MHQVESEVRHLLPSLSDISFSGVINRKRQLSEYGSLSSDPLFSEDASDAGDDEDIGQPRRKRLVKGPWWTPGRKAGHSLRRNMAKNVGFRNVDSGVWMGSDDSLDSLKSSQAIMEGLGIQDIERQTPADSFMTIMDPDALAAEIVMRCVDNGKERVDLSDLGLDKISDGTLKPLEQMIRHVHNDLTRPPSEDEFFPLTPSLQLFLSANKLSSLPPELFRLANLTVLSLRNNNLEEIPPAISKLSQLQELNIAGNALQWLPWELLDMIRSLDESRKLSVRPNPLLPLDLDTMSDRATEAVVSSLRQGRRACTQFDEPDMLRAERLGRDHLVCLASSGIRYFDVAGSVSQTSTTIRHVVPENAWHRPIWEVQPPPTTDHMSRAPSLFESALRTIQRNHSLAEMQSATQLDLPGPVLQGLGQAIQGVEIGNRKCSYCDAEFLTPRAEWLEYWFHGQMTDVLCEEKILPFRRLACSWACARVTAPGTGLA